MQFSQPNQLITMACKPVNYMTQHMQLVHALSTAALKLTQIGAQQCIEATQAGLSHLMSGGYPMLGLLTKALRLPKAGACSNNADRHPRLGLLQLAL